MDHKYCTQDGTLFVKAISPINIALVKYWGKLESTAIIPANSSLSITIDTADMRSETVVSLVKSDVPAVKLMLNGKESAVTDRISNVIDTIKAKALEHKELLNLKFQQKGGEGTVDVSLEEMMSCSIKIESNNNFNTAAGLASSSSGLSCLGVALATLFGLPADKVDFSVLARIGSGSAVRSVYGGFVLWEKGWEQDERKAIMDGDKNVIDSVS